MTVDEIMARLTPQEKQHVSPESVAAVLRVISASIADTASPRKNDPRDPGNWRDGDDAMGAYKESIADTAGAKARESLQLTCEQAIRLNAALESPSEPNEALKGAMEKFRAQESRERVTMTYEQFTELASKAKASNDLHMRVLALEASSYLKDEEISHLRKRIAAPPAPSVADAAGASERIAQLESALSTALDFIDDATIEEGQWHWLDDVRAAIAKESGNAS